MTPSIKKLCVFGLAAGIGNMLLSQAPKMDMSMEEKDLAIWNAKRLSEAGQSALDKCKVKVDMSALKRVHAKIDQVCKNKDLFDVAEMLSFLFLGLDELERSCNNKEIIVTVRDAALNFITLFDPNLEDEAIHSVALERYERWVA